MQINTTSSRRKKVKLIVNYLTIKFMMQQLIDYIFKFRLFGVGGRFSLPPSNSTYIEILQNLHNLCVMKLIRVIIDSLN